MALAAPDHTVPYGTVLSRALSWHFVPGYDRTVPPGTGWQTVRNGTFTRARMNSFLRHIYTLTTGNRHSWSIPTCRRSGLIAVYRFKE
jgi:hypothetical protein